MWARGPGTGRGDGGARQDRREGRVEREKRRDGTREVQTVLMQEKKRKNKTKKTVLLPSTGGKGT